jgi:probable H4MPT-linked C1 transfer pathway protein
MTLVLGLDIGGANTKYVLLSYTNKKAELLMAESEYFPFWKDHQKLALFLTNLKEKIESKFGLVNQVSFVTTAELADCYQTKKEGIKDICSAVDEVFSDKNPVIMDVNGNFINMADASKKWLEVAATNWFASASLIGLHYPNAIVIDIGSTTTDFIPVNEGKVVAKGKNDLERLTSKELVYTGLLRTNVATVVQNLKVRSENVSISSEFFATTGDVYFILDDLEASEFTVETADGKPITKRNSLARIARVVCADLNQLSKNELLDIAKQIKLKQIQILSSSLEKVLQNYQKKYKIIPEFVLIGSGARVIGSEILKQLDISSSIFADEIFIQETTNCFNAFAVAELYCQWKLAKNH